MMNKPFVTTVQPIIKRAHCEFCGGKGDSLKAEVVRSAVGTLYRIPASHVTCKQSALSLSLSLFLSLSR